MREKRSQLFVPDLGGTFPLLLQLQLETRLDPSPTMRLHITEFFTLSGAEFEIS